MVGQVSWIAWPLSSQGWGWVHGVGCAGSRWGGGVGKNTTKAIKGNKNGLDGDKRKGGRVRCVCVEVDVCVWGGGGREDLRAVFGTNVENRVERERRRSGRRGGTGSRQHAVCNNLDHSVEKHGSVGMCVCVCVCVSIRRERNGRGFASEQKEEKGCVCVA